MGSKGRHAHQLAAAASRRRAAADASARAYQPDARIVYLCPTCGHYTITVKLEDGTVPSQIGCRRDPFCPAKAEHVPIPDPWPPGVPPAPAWEWFRPDADSWAKHRTAGGSIWAHLTSGGLLIRQRITTRRR